MATLDQKREAIRTIFQYFTGNAEENTDVHYEVIADSEHDRYLLMALGWEGDRRIHHPLLHLNIVDDCIWIEANNTDRSVAEELVELRIPPREIVFGVQPPELRPLTGYGPQPTAAA
ncbi:MAG: XisI protein [Cyanophyceae cyanobacterium]